MIEATVQLCTYNRAALLERVLEACFDQLLEPERYEVVLVNDGSTDSTAATIERARAHAPCLFTVVHQENGGLSNARNAGIAHANGRRIIFIDDDVLPLPNFVGEHLRAGMRRPEAIVRGGAIDVEDFDNLPTPVWSIRNYSGNYFWTTNVSVPLATIRAIGGFDESFAEYGWEDIDVGLRLRARRVPAVFHPAALVYHYKPPRRVRDVERMVAQARAQARTAVRLIGLHPHWRAYLATGINPAQRGFHEMTRRAGFAGRVESRLAALAPDAPLRGRELRLARALATEAYFEELERALAAER
ncbi:MAG: glycosyltransferase family 2 protein [Candidatus Eremiobacteraeota bacterium]|nr:glycosyltransferase family 2 protein [Candidatus Eremiobacteraeota bacterium]MBV9263614.1 glycosyltransferase family 2 protein [Candidatus Eremiobacteraeota bacterium]